MNSKCLILLSLLILLLPVAQAEDEEILVTTKTLTPEAALKVALATQSACRKSGYQVSVAVLDGGGNIQVVLRDRFAGITTPDSAILKAKTAVSFRTATSSMVEALTTDPELSGIKYLPGVLVLAGGVMIQQSGAMIGAVGVAGAPTGKSDEKCATLGIESIQELLDFAE